VVINILSSRSFAITSAVFLLALSSCKSDEEKEMEKCESYLSEPSAGFPNFTENPDDGSPALDFQVCDSKPVDLNGDGLLDFAAADHIDPGFGFFMQDPSGNPAFDAGQTVPFVASDASNSAGIVADDYNFDGIPDIANSDHAGAVTVRINATPPGSGVDEVDFPTAGETTISLGLNHADSHGFAGIEGGLISADFNGDGKVDIATANLAPTLSDNLYTASFLLNTTADPVDDGMGNLTYSQVASFGPVQNVELPAAAISIDAADFNGDGVPDVVTTNTAAVDEAASVLTNMTTAGSSTISFTRLDLVIPHGDNPAGAGPTNPVAADFNNDGKPDFATANWNVDTVTVFTNTTETGGETSFAPDPFTIELCFNPLVLRNGDLDNDGDQDLVIVPLDISTSIAVGLIENTSEAGSDIPSMALVDIIYLPERMQEVTFWDWLDGSSGGDSPNTWFTSTGNVADFDNDGKLDIVAAIAHAGFALEAQSHLQQTDNILEYVVPPINLHIAEIFLPRHTELIQLVQD
jgi:hypothetical protein